MDSSTVAADSQEWIKSTAAKAADKAVGLTEELLSGARNVASDLADNLSDNAARRIDNSPMLRRRRRRDQLRLALLAATAGAVIGYLLARRTPPASTGPADTDTEAPPPMA